MARVLFTFVAMLILSMRAHACDAEEPLLTFGGFVDGYYSYNFNQPQQTAAADASTVSEAALPAGTNTYRYYDSYHNQLTLNLVEFSVLAKYQEVSLLTDLIFGPFADMNATVSSAAGTSSDEVSKHIGQTVVSYRPIGSRWFFDAGKMYSHVGLETVKSKDNFNYSRTILFSYGMPLWHTGARIGYDVIPEKFQPSFYVYNGWNTIYDTNESKTLGVQLKCTPASDFALTYNFIGGAEQPRDESGWKTVHELNVTYVSSPVLTLASDLLYGSERAAKWYGGLFMAKYVVGEKSYLSPRYEIYRDDGGLTLGQNAQTINSVTLTYGQFLTKGFEFRSEARFDKSNEMTFAAKAGNKDSQTTFLVALLFNF